MRLVIHSKDEAVLDIDDVKVLFINSKAVAMVKKMYKDKDIWEAYRDSAIVGDVSDSVKLWLGDYTLGEFHIGLLDKALHQVLRLCI